MRTYKNRSKSSPAKLYWALSVIAKPIVARNQLSECQLANALGLKLDGAIPDLLSAKDAAEFLGLSPKTLANWRLDGRQRLPFQKIGSRVFYKSADLIAFVERSSRQSTSDQLRNNSLK